MSELDLNLPRKWIKVFILLQLAELTVLVLAFAQPILLIFLIIAFAGLLTFYFLFVKVPFTWILFLIIASGLEVWGRINENITVFHVIYVLSLIGLGCYILFHQNAQPLVLDTPMNKYVFAYLGFSLVSLLYSPNLVSGITYISVSFALFIFFLVVVNFIKSDLHLKAIVVTLLLMNTLITILLIYQFIKGDFIQGVMDATVNTGGFKFYRAVGTFSDPNVAATFMVTGVILAFSLLIHSRDRFITKLFYLTGSLFSILGIIITFSRSGWIFLAVGIFVSLFFIYNKKKLVVIILFLSLLVILTTFTTPLGALISDRFLSIFELFKDPSIKARILMGESGFRMFLDSPIWGFGYRSFPLVYDYYINPDMPWETLYIRESHTLFIYLLAELGVIGFVIVFLWFRRVLIDCFKFIRVDKNHFTRAILIGSFSLFIAFNVNFLFYGNLFPQFNLIWLNFGLIYTVILKERTTLLNQSSI